MTKAPTHLLFVCSRNEWRGPTAARFYASQPQLEVRAAGTSRRAPHRLAEADIEWADLILVMESKHRDQIQRHFEIGARPLHVLDVPDDYRLTELVLVEQITAAVDPILASWWQRPTPPGPGPGGAKGGG